MDEHEDIRLTPGAIKAIERGDDLLAIQFRCLDHGQDSISLEGNVAFWVEIAEALYHASQHDAEGEALYDAFCDATFLERVDPGAEGSDDDDL